MKTNLFIRSLALPLAATVLSLPSSTNSCLAQTPTPSAAAPSPAGVSWHKIAVKNALPSNIFATMHWNDPTYLPPGVAKVYALEGDNSLFIQATPDGFDKLKETLRTLDVLPMTVQIKVLYARVPLADVQASGIKFTSFPFPVTAYQMEHRIDSSFWPPKPAQTASGGKVTALLDYLKQNGTRFVHLPLVIAPNNVSTRVNLSPSDFSDVDFVPHIQQNQSILTSLTMNVNEYLPSFQNGPIPTQQMTIKQTITSGTPFLLAGLEMDGKTEFLVFITPTLPTEQKQTDDSAKN